MTLPSDVTNIILDYYSQMNDMKWQPFIETSTGKLKWKVNKHSTKYKNIEKILTNQFITIKHGINYGFYINVISSSDFKPMRDYMSDYMSFYMSNYMIYI